MTLKNNQPLGKVALDYLFKQIPLVVVLVLGNFFQYNYFTNVIKENKLEYGRQIDKLESKIDILEKQNFINKLK